MLLNMQTDPSSAESTAFFPWLIWYLWKARNDKCFNNKDTSPVDTLQLAVSEATTWKLAQILPDILEAVDDGNERIAEVEEQERVGRWRCQLDASWVLEDTGVGLSFIVFDGDMEVMRGQRKLTNVPSPLHAEAESLVWAMEELSSRGFQQVRLESDCQQLVHVINFSKKWLALEPELDAIEALRTSFISFSLSFIPRSLNFRADALAKEARSRELHYMLVDSLVSIPLAHEASTIGPV